jgi:hypothetical protein
LIGKVHEAEAPALSGFTVIDDLRFEDLTVRLESGSQA